MYVANYESYIIYEQKEKNTKALQTEQDFSLAF